MTDLHRLPASLWLDLLGKPFVADGRGPDSYDCVGLLLEIQRRMGRTLPAYRSGEPDLGLAMATWKRVQHPQPGDGILLRSDNPRWHIGVVAGGGYMLHAFPGHGVARERYDAFPWHKRIEGFYRWQPA